ncbi:threonine ammonia-lyase [Sporomusa acidovorans]|uniref:L-threonine dehydratase catabolic TdcB n=1 Tax=Sporomusa acidovorans (strain ATCC 49682 / DSM 3132 / Mol) TaxID=1123286 RepID=A0ABZ3JBT0_SPOA4|nr:threonine ammonia-lyase [Sporomusa acidovorans]OZC21659.1 L-threonine dehydratase catabolic TdcB [Sporomusa acidovorans DSM 3132]SDD60799.1 threonine dehydratase [Sporomusa acidovorans]
MNVSLAEIKKARELLSGIVCRTELAYTNTLSDITGNKIYLKMENQQRTGSFKLRGAYNKVANLSKDAKKNGIIASSAGNHAQGTALAGTLFGIPSTIVMPKNAPLSKVKATRAYGASVVLHGCVYDEAYAEARRMQAEKQLTFIHPFDDPLVIAGQGTIGMEILEDLPDLEAVVVPVGGGGLIAGVALAVKSLKPQVKVIGVQTKNMPSMAESITRQRIITYNGCPTIADGIAVKTPGELTFELVQRYVDEIVTVDEEEIAGSILLLMERIKTISEGAGAASVAAVLHRLPAYQNKKIAAIISGGNIDVNMMSRIINKGLTKSGRKVVFNMIIPDKPGSLWQLLKLMAETGANVLTVTHDRETRDVALGHASVQLELETADQEHIDAIKNLMEQHQYCVNIL